MSFKIVFSIIIGASLGALLRYGISVKLNPIFPSIPLGTLTVNWIGSFIMGITICIVMHSAALPKELIIGVVSGFLGSLTTLSTFSAETFELIIKKEYLYTCLQIVLHVAGSIGLVALGFFLCKVCFFTLGEK